ncbi:hypothetical protein [Halorubellus salinus]|uniref:hypothetical protein n=1 Tax=Halorubellus salinus TaxID=755309 RepID=UPI001D0658B0|nr:hypothetical protein [Halorubellus salinus]
MELETLTVVIVLAAAVTGVTVAVSSTVAAGQQTETVLGDVLEGPAANQSTSDWALSGVETGLSYAEGERQRLQWWAFSLPGGVADALGVSSSSEPTASAKANALQETWNANNETLAEYASSRRDWTSNKTVALTVLVDGESTTRFVLANASNGSVSTRMVSSTNRTPTDDVELCGYAAKRAPSELESFVDEYAAPNESVTTSYLAELRGKYGQDVETSLYSSTGSCGSANVTTSKGVAYAG